MKSMVQSMRQLWENSGPQWNISEIWKSVSSYVEYLTPISSEYIKSWVILSPTSTSGQTSRIPLADVIPWINKAIALCCISASMLMPCRDQPDIRKLYSAVEFISCDWSIKTRYFQGCEWVSDSIPAIEVLVLMWFADCACAILATLTTLCTVRTMQLLGM